MNLPKAVVALLISVLFVSCATSYQSSSFTGGFSETWLAPDTVRVNFAGNGFTTPERAQDLALLRAADLTLSRGFTHFILLGEMNTLNRQTITTPGQTYTNGSVNVYGNTAYYTGNTTYVPGMTFDVVKPRTGLMVRCLHGTQGMRAFDARFLQDSLRAKYKIKPKATPAATGPVSKRKPSPAS